MHTHAATKSSRPRLTLSLAGASLAVLLGSAPLRAFNTYPAPAEHSQITKDAATAQVFQNTLNRRLCYEVRQPDWDETSWSTWAWAFVSNANYRAQHHFDRCPKGAAPFNSHAGAFNAGRSYLLEQLDVAIAQTNAENWNAARVACGRALHALQDFFAHSNFIDLNAADQAATKIALFDSSKATPDQLKITSFDPGETDPELPDLPGGGGADPYPHKTFSKDSPTKNAESKIKVGGKTKFELAYDAAESSTEELFQKLPAAFNREVEGAHELHGSGSSQKPIGPANGFPYSDVGQYAWSLSQVVGPAGGSLSGFGVTLSVNPGTFAQPESIQVLGLVQNAFYTQDQVEARDGARIGPWWEVAIGDRTHNDPVPPGITFTFTLPDSFLALYAGLPTEVFVFDPDSSDWFPEALIGPGSQAQLPIRRPLTLALGVRVNAGVGPAGGDAPGIPRILAVMPSPSRGPAVLHFAVAPMRPAKIEVFDISGALIRSFDIAASSATEARVTWDGTDSRGEPTPAGVYLARITQAQRSAGARIVRLE